jgi:predicted ester cyclase
MSAETNKQLVRQLFEAMNRGDNGLFDRLLSPDFVCYVGGMSEPARGREMNKQMDAAFRRAFSDIRYSVVDIVAERDTVAVRRTWSMKHTGAFEGIEPSNRELTGTAMDFLRIVDVKIVEQWSESDNLSFMQQLGALPTSEHGGI